MFVITWIVIKSNKSEKVDVGDGIPSCMIQAYNRAYEDVIRAGRADAMKGLSMDPQHIRFEFERKDGNVYIYRER